LIELRESRKEIDLRDLEKFTIWLKQHNPFAQLSGELISLASGFVCDELVNCDQVYEIGLRTMEKSQMENVWRAYIAQEGYGKNSKSIKES
jgi:hypothetical protein